MDTETTAPGISKPSSADWLLSNFIQFEKALNGGASLPLHARRLAALESYKKAGFPSSSLEEWKYTNPAPILEKSFPLIELQQSVALKQEGNSQFFTSKLDTIKIEVINGQVVFLDKCPEGVEVASIYAAQKSGGKMSKLVEQHLAQHASTDEAFVAMNTSLLNDGVVVHITKTAQPPAQIEVLFRTDEIAKEKSILPRLLVVSEAQTEATVIERYHGPIEQQYWTNSVAEFVVGENAVINHYRVQQESTAAFHISTIHAAVQKYGNFRTHTFSFGGKLVRNHVNVILQGSNCHAIMNGLSVLTEDQHVDNATLLDNTMPYCESIELYKGIYGDRSQGVFSGTIIVRPDAQKTNAIQSNKSVLLSDQASVNTKPQLKIWADDVKCTHGATIGQLDEQALFYIRSRGVSEKEAKVMLVHAFASEVISAVGIPPLREYLQEQLLEKLHLNPQ